MEGRARMRLQMAWPMPRFCVCCWHEVRRKRGKWSYCTCDDDYGGIRHGVVSGCLSVEEQMHRIEY